MSDLTPPGPPSESAPEPTPPPVGAAAPYAPQMPYGGYGVPQHAPPSDDKGLLWTGFWLALVVCVPLLPLTGAILGIVALARKRIQTKWPAVVAVVAGLLLSVLQGAAVPGIVDGFNEAMREEMGIDPEADTIPLSDLRPGTCFNDDALFEAVDDTEGVEARPIVELVPCDEKHQFEVVHTFDIEGKKFPGEQGVWDEVRKCLPKWRAYVGTPYRMGGRLEISAYYPTERSWGFGDRRITCSLYLRNGNLLSASQRR